MSSNVPTVTLSVELPIDAFESLNAFASLMGVTVEHAAALTIFVGQMVQRADELNAQAICSEVDKDAI